VTLEDEDGRQRLLFLGPEGAGLKIGEGDALVTVITACAAGAATAGQEAG
jgi:uncharacterized protein YjlB